jgi:SAM-dependent methyltransferase
MWGERVLRRLYLDGFARGLVDNYHATRWAIGWRRGRDHGKVDRALIERYLREAGTRKLQIGCGRNPLPGWLNCDLYPDSHDVLHMDARGRFPLPDGAFDYVFSEHMIEHVSYAEGASMLAECHRVMKPGGRIRVSTPDLRFLIDLYGEQKSPLQQAYIRWATQTFTPGAPAADETFVINNYVRDWGHLFIYDERTLRASLERAGFGAVLRQDLNESASEALRNLENEERMPPGFLKLETLTLEATR